jgi:hypothetical protein
MLTFVVWCIGIVIIIWLARFNLFLVLAAFESHALLGMLAVIISLAVWLGIACVIL